MSTKLEINEVLRTARGRLRRRAARRQSLRVLTWTIGLLGTAVVFDHLYRFTDWQRWVACGALFVVLGIVYWFGRDRLRQGRKLSDLFVARELEKANPALHNTLVTALQADRPVSFSKRMRSELDVAVAAIGAPSTRSPYRWALPTTVLLLVVYGFTAPQSVWQSTSRVLMPWRDVAPPTYTVIVAASPADGDYLVTENPWRVSITAAGYAPETGELHVRRDGGPWQKLPLAKTPEANQYVATLPPVSGTWALRARLGDAYVSQRHVRILQRPAALGVRQQLIYPDYLDQADADLKQWPVQAVVGTRVNLEIQLDRNVDAAKLDWCGTSIALRPVGRLLRTNAAIPVEHSGNWRVYYRLPEADDWIRGDGAQVTAVPDLLPKARILQPKHDVEVSADSLVEFQYEATDDFIVKSPEIIVRRFGSDETREIPLPQAVLPDRLAGSWTFLPQEFHAQPGDRFTVAMRIRDGHPGHLPGWSDAIGITVTAPVAPLVANNEIELSEAQQPESRPESSQPQAADPEHTPPPAESTKPDKPPTDEQLANAKPVDKPADPEQQPDTVVKTDKIPENPDGKQQPITKTNTEPTGDNGDKPQPDQQPQDTQTAQNNDNNEGAPKDQQPNQGGKEPNGQQTAENDAQQGETGEQQTAATDKQEPKPDQQPDQAANKQPDQKPGDKPGEQEQAAAESKKCEKCGEKSNGSKQCKKCEGGKPGGNKPGAGQKQAADDPNGTGQEPGQQAAANQENGQKPSPNGKPDNQPGDQQAREGDQQTADNQQPGGQANEKPTASNTPDGDSTGPGAEFAGNQTGDGDPTAESALPNDDPALPEFTETEAPTAADAANPFEPKQTTDHKADLATNQAPIPSDAPNATLQQPGQTDDEPFPDELETFERMTLDAQKRFEEAQRKPGAPNPKPGFAPAQYNADDVDLIQSFREAANRLLRQKKK